MRLRVSTGSAVSEWRCLRSNWWHDEVQVECGYISQGSDSYVRRDRVRGVYLAKSRRNAAQLGSAGSEWRCLRSNWWHDEVQVECGSISQGSDSYVRRDRVRGVYLAKSRRNAAQLGSAGSEWRCLRSNWWHDEVQVECGSISPDSDSCVSRDRVRGVYLAKSRQNAAQLCRDAGQCGV